MDKIVYLWFMAAIILTVWNLVDQLLYGWSDLSFGILVLIWIGVYLSWRQHKA